MQRIEVSLKEFCVQDASAFWAIVMTAFLGFFRLGELLVKSKLAYNPSIDLRWGDVSSTLALQHQ